MTEGPGRGARWATGLGCMVAFGCAPETVPPAAELTPEVLPFVPVIQVALQPPTPPPDRARGAELAGQFTVMVELGLCDLPGVLATVAGAPPSPGLGAPLAALGRSLTGTLSMWAADPGIVLGFELCEAEAPCATWSEPAEPLQIDAAVDALLVQAAAHLGRAAPDTLRARWSRPMSADPYAVLLAGRAAAALYGLGPAATPERIGHRRQDPIDRAVLVDPHAAPAAWVLTRRDAARGEPARALTPLARAQAARPESVVLAAAAAELEADLGRHPAARLAWEAVARRAPGDARFVLPQVRSLLRAGAIDAASAQLDGLPPEAQGEPPVVALRVQIADRGGEASDELLARWQAADLHNPLPVHRRLALRIRAERWQEALDLVDELARRGEPESAAALSVPLALAVGQPSRAIEAARALGREDVAQRIATRADWETESPDCASTLAPETRLACAEAALAAGAPALAVAAAQAHLRSAPGDPDAWALVMVGLTQLGDPVGATDARRHLAWADPAHPALEG